MTRPVCKTATQHDMDGTERFPVVRWGDDWVTFDISRHPASSGSVGAVVVFTVHRSRFVLANIAGRGWCTPSGRLEPGESPIDAALRETREEIGAELGDAREIGSYVLTDASGATRQVPAFVGHVAALGALPAGSESRAVGEYSLVELPGVYWMWDELLAAMFTYVSRLAAEPGTE